MTLEDPDPGDEDENEDIDEPAWDDDAVFWDLIDSDNRGD